MKIFIRPLESSDQDFLFEMLYESIYTPPGQERPDRKIVRDANIRKYVESWGEHKGDWGLAALKKETDEPLGALWLRYFTEKDKGYGFVAESIPELGIALHPEYRGLGIGTQLMQKTLEIMPASIQSLSLSVDPGNPAARLYKRFGFKECGTSGTSITMLFTL